jgi:hypothetical protein
MAENKIIDAASIVRIQRMIDLLPPGPERDRRQGVLDRLIAKLDALPGRIADLVVGVDDPAERLAIVTRELEYVTSELPGGRSVGN